MVHASLTYPEAIVIGLLQGVTELFPVSSLGHSILLPAVIGGQWARDLSMSADQSPYLAFVVAVHVATAVALVWSSAPTGRGSSGGCSPRCAPGRSPTPTSGSPGC